MSVYIVSEWFVGVGVQVAKVTIPTVVDLVFPSDPSAINNAEIDLRSSSCRGCGKLMGTRRCRPL